MNPKYYKKILFYQKCFEDLIQRIKEEKDFNNQLQISKELLLKATVKNCGYFSSLFFEKFFTDYAKRIDIKRYDIDYQSNSFLHVLTTGYKTGGHTRVVERWIKNAPEEQIHSVIILSPEKNTELKILRKNVEEKNGEYIEFSTNNLEDKALRLREIGLKYEYIVLHIHMHDPTALIAFGTEKFTRPVLFYNHASHLFSVGISIADAFLDLYENDVITTKKRHIKNPFFLGVPTENAKILKNYKNKSEIRKNLNLPVNKKIIVLSGTPYKFNSPDDDSMFEILMQLAKKDIFMYIIGPDKKDKIWEKLYKKSKNHINPIGCIDYDKGYLDYISSADLVLDSYPLQGGAAMIDAVSLGIPVLSLKGILPQFDYLIKTSAYCKSKEELLAKAEKILNNIEYSNAVVKELQNSLLEYQSKDAWLKRIDNILKNIPNKHKVNIFSENSDYKEIDTFAIFVNWLLNPKNFLKPVTDIRYLFCRIMIFIYRYIIVNSKKEIKFMLKLYS